MSKTKRLGRPSLTRDGGATPIRSVRFDDAAWLALEARARQEGVNRGALIRAIVDAYLKG